MKQKKKELTIVQKEYAIDQLIMFPMSPEWNKIALLKSARFNLHRKSFLKDLLKQTNNENKTGKVWLL